MAESFTASVREMEQCGQVLRKNMIATTTATNLLPAPGSGYKYLILGVQLTSDAAAVFTFTGLNTGERSSGGKFVMNCPVGGVSFNGPMYAGIFSTADNTALGVTASAGSNAAIYVQYVVCKV